MKDMKFEKCKNNTACKEPTKEEILNVANTLSNETIQEFANDYNISLDKAKQELAEYIAWNQINN